MQFDFIDVRLISFLVLLATAIFYFLTYRYKSWQSLRKGIFLALGLALGVLLLFFYRHHTDFKAPPFTLEQAKNITNLVPVAVIGGGSAGLSAAMYTARARLPTVLFGGTNVGGELLEANYVENWPAKEKLTGIEMISDLKKQAKHFGAKVTKFLVTSVDFNSWPFTLTLDNGDTIHALSVIITTGGKQRLPEIPGVDKYMGKGIGICPICDGPFDKGKEVIVVGGGDAAADKALLLAQYAQKVTILVRGDKMRAAAVVQEYVKEQPKITIRYNVELKELIGNEERASGVVVLDTKTNQKEKLEMHTVYFALGFAPNSQLFKGKLKLDEEGYILLKCRTHCTSQPGVFAAGNIADNRYQKAGYAAGSGIGAGLDAIDFMSDLGFTPQHAQELADSFYKVPAQRIVSPLVNDGDLEIVMKDKKDILILFHSRNCPDCREVLQKMKTTDAIPEEASVVSVDIDQMPQLAQQYTVERVPVVIRLKDGKEISNIDRVNAQKLEEELQKQFPKSDVLLSLRCVKLKS